MATLQLLPVTTINGTAYATAQIIITPLSPDRRKLILPKIEPTSDSSACNSPTIGGCARERFSKPREEKMENSQFKRKLTFSAAAQCQIKPTSVTKRNARERNRVKQVNQGFVTLASHVPSNMRPKKMSKVETLKSAIKYIRHLRQVVEQQQQQTASTATEKLEQLQQQLQMQQHTMLLPQRPTTHQPHAYPVHYSSQQPGSTKLSCSHHLHSPPAMHEQFFYTPGSPAYDIPSPTSSVSSSTSCAYDTDTSCEPCLSPDDEDLLDFASWFN